MVREYEDKIQLGIPGWKDRYYKQKFHVSPQENKHLGHGFIHSIMPHLLPI